MGPPEETLAAILLIHNRLLLSARSRRVEKGTRWCGVLRDFWCSSTLELKRPKGGKGNGPIDVLPFLAFHHLLAPLLAAGSFSQWPAQ